MTNETPKSRFLQTRRDLIDVLTMTNIVCHDLTFYTCDAFIFLTLQCIVRQGKSIEAGGKTTGLHLGTDRPSPILNIQSTFLGICPVLFPLTNFYQDVNINGAHIPGDICPILFYLQVFIKMPILNIQPTFLGIYVQFYLSFYQDVNSKETFILGDMSNIIPLTSLYEDVNSNEALILESMSSYILLTSCFQDANFYGAFIIGDMSSFIFIFVNFDQV